jgi:hypothetical protein
VETPVTTTSLVFAISFLLLFLATAATTDIQTDAHNYSVTRVFPKIGETGTTQEIINLLERIT